MPKARPLSLSLLSLCTRSSSSMFELLLPRDLLLLHFGKRFCHWVSAGIPILALCIFLLSVAFSAGKLLLGLWIDSFFLSFFFEYTVVDARTATLETRNLTLEHRIHSYYKGWGRIKDDTVLALLDCLQ